MDNLALAPLANGQAVVVLGGVSGSGMIGLARMCLQKDLKVYGCDQQKSQEVASLESAGLHYFSDSDEIPIEHADLVVCSSALSTEHPMRKWAAAQHIPVAGRAEMLAALLDDREVILVVGTHGKTTTAVLIAHALRKLGRDISFYIGAEVPLFGTSAYLGQDPIAVVEADESDGSFSYFSPSHVLVLNVEEDHLDHYSNLEEIVSAFQHVVERCEGNKIVCGDDPVAVTAFRENSDVVYYGFKEKAEMRGTDWVTGLDGSRYQAELGHNRQYEVKVALKGKHNALNVLGVIAMGIRLGYEPEELTGLFADVRGARRRFEILVSNSFGTVVDDYAHHPTEIKATVTAVEKNASQRLICVFQPHRYSRTEKLMEYFKGCFEGADQVYITDVYGAGEKEERQHTAERLVKVIGSTQSGVQHFSSLEDLKLKIRAGWQNGDQLLVMGAGDINKVAYQIAGEVAQAAEIEKLAEGGAIECKLYEPMSRHTTLKVGGPSDLWINVNSETAFAAILNYAKTRTIPIHIIGRGTNLLVKDKGIRGICCHLAGGDFEQIKFDGNRVYCGAGVRLKDLVNQAKKLNLGGLEFMEGIPGSVGGALCMNAGAMKSWTFEVVQSVRMMDPAGEVHKLSVEEIEVKYRSVPILKEYVALGATLKLVNRSRDEINKIIQEYSSKRWDSQPPKPSAGCSFKNPGELPAGKLVEELGLKGKKVGGATISTVHGNFIVNDGGATAEDVIALISFVKETAREKRDIVLETEVIVLGE